MNGGHNLILVARSTSILENIKSKAGRKVEVLKGDFEDHSTGQKAVDLAISTFGQLDGLVLNHGILGEVKRVADGDPMEWRRTFDVNFFSILACVRRATQSVALLMSFRSKRPFHICVIARVESSSHLQVLLKTHTLPGARMGLQRRLLIIWPW